MPEELDCIVAQHGERECLACFSFLPRYSFLVHNATRRDIFGSIFLMPFLAITVAVAKMGALRVNQ
jgi:hypothetical protein